MTVAELYEMACMMEMENTELTVNVTVDDDYYNLDKAPIMSVTFGADGVQLDIDSNFPEPFKAPEPDNSAWDFQWSGRGDYETERRAFYGEFS